MNSNIAYLLSGLLAFIPALVWLRFIISGKNKNRKVQAFIFLSGILTVAPIFLLNFFFFNYPQYDLISYIQQQYPNPHLQFLILFAWVSIIEEFLKQWVVRFVDDRKLIIETIGDSIHYSLIAALGFSFAENIFYFYQIGTELSPMAFLSAFFFRSIFTTSAHLVFSGIFGYFYGIAKFSIDVYEHAKWTGKKFKIVKLLARMLNISKFQAYKEIQVLQGLLYAILLHTIFNYLLELNQIIPATLFISACFIYLRYLLKHKAGKLVLITDSSEEQESSMAKSDEDVVIELVGLWFNQKRYVDVLHICNRLLKRDPDNKIVQLFKAKAMDKMEGNNPYQQILAKLFPDKNKTSSLAEMSQKNISKQQ